MLCFRDIFLFAGFCLLTFFSQTSVAANPPDFALAVNLQQKGIPLHAGIGVLALVLAAMGWVRRCRRRKSS